MALEIAPPEGAQSINLLDSPAQRAQTPPFGSHSAIIHGVRADRLPFGESPEAKNSDKMIEP